MKNDMKKRILSAQLALILLLMLWCGTYLETKESQRQMEQLEASQSESGASNAVEVKRKLMYKAMHTPLGKYPETVTYRMQLLYMPVQCHVTGSWIKMEM